jgi:hypothetical protein
MGRTLPPPDNSDITSDCWQYTHEVRSSHDGHLPLFLRRVIGTELRVASAIRLYLKKPVAIRCAKTHESFGVLLTYAS